MPNEVRGRVERQLRFNFTQYAPAVRRLEVKLMGGGDSTDDAHQEVRVRVCLKDRPDIIVEDVQRDFRTAVDRAIDRAARAIRLRLLPKTPVSTSIETLRARISK